MNDIILNQLSYPILSLTVFLPLLGMVLLFFLKHEKAIRWMTLFLTIAVFFISLPLYTHFDKSTYKMQFVEKHEWIPSLGIQYAVGIDGISILFILLTTLLSVLSVLVSWKSIRNKVKEFHIALLAVESAMLGVFVALDFLLFYIFWEAMLIPMFLLIGVWGGERRIYSAVKFFLYTLVGSILMLVGIVALYLKGGNTLDILALRQMNFSKEIQIWLFWAFFAAFAVKVPMFPFHTWLPDAHTEAPTAGSVILAGVLLKMGAYGFLRFSIPMFPEAVFLYQKTIIVLSVLAIVYGALLCLAQKDIKRLIAYSSVSHMGFVTLGIFALNRQGLEGGILQMVNHGVITGALFLMIGIIYERTYTREISNYGGLAGAVPVFAAFFMILTLAAIGLPGMNGFIGEFLILLGAISADPLFGIFAATGIILGAVYMLRLYQKVFFQELNKKYLHGKLWDLDLREFFLLIPLLAMIFWIGLYPDAFLSYLHASVEHLVSYTRSCEIKDEAVLLPLIRGL